MKEEDYRIVLIEGVLSMRYAFPFASVDACDRRTLDDPTEIVCPDHLLREEDGPVLHRIFSIDCSPWCRLDVTPGTDTGTLPIIVPEDTHAIVMIVLDLLPDVTEKILHTAEGATIRTVLATTDLLVLLATILVIVSWMIDILLLVHLRVHAVQWAAQGTVPSMEEETQRDLEITEWNWVLNREMNWEIWQMRRFDRRWRHSTRTTIKETNGLLENRLFSFLWVRWMIDCKCLFLLCFFFVWILFCLLWLTMT